MAFKGWLRVFLMMIVALAAASLFAPSVVAEGTPRPAAIEAPLYIGGKFGVVRGLVYQDWDEDGQWDPEEPPLAEATLSLLDAQGIEVGRTITERDGIFRFWRLEPGEYILIETPPLGYSSLQETKLVVTVKAGQASEVNFANVLWLLNPGPGLAQE